MLGWLRRLRDYFAEPVKTYPADFQYHHLQSRLNGYVQIFDGEACWVRVPLGHRAAPWIPATRIAPMSRLSDRPRPTRDELIRKRGGNAEVLPGVDQMALLMIRDERRCRYCRRKVVRRKGKSGERLPGDTATRDHVIPRARGGSNDLRNLVLCCLRCNHEKGALTAEEYAGRNWDAAAEVEGLRLRPVGG